MKVPVTSMAFVITQRGTHPVECIEVSGHRRTRRGKHVVAINDKKRALPEKAGYEEQREPAARVMHGRSLQSDRLSISKRTD